MTPDQRDQKTQTPAVREPEAEFDGPIWKHPYFLYVWLTAVLFIFLGVATWLAKTNDWIPNRGGG